MRGHDEYHVNLLLGSDRSCSRLSLRCVSRSKSATVRSSLAVLAFQGDLAAGVDEQRGLSATVGFKMLCFGDGLDGIDGVGNHALLHDKKATVPFICISVWFSPHQKPWNFRLATLVQ